MLQPLPPPTEYRLIGCLFTVESVSACDSHCISAKSTKCFVFFFSITFDQLRSWKLEVLEPALSFRECLKVREKYILSSVQFIPLSSPHFFELKFVLIPPESNIQLKISDHWYHAILSTCFPCLDTSPMMLLLVLLLLLLLLLMLLLSFWLLMLLLLLLLLWLSMFLSFFFLFSSAIIPSTTSLTLTRNGNYKNRKASKENNITENLQLDKRWIFRLESYSAFTSSLSDTTKGLQWLQIFLKNIVGVI